MRPTAGLSAARAWLVLLLMVGALASPAAWAQAQPRQAGGDQAQQLKALQKAVADRPESAEAHLALAQFYIDTGRYDRAVESARAAQRVGHANDAADALLAWGLYLSEQRDLLFKQVKPGDRAPRHEAMVRLSLGLASLVPSDLDRAESLLRDAAQLDPQSWRAQIAYARVLTLKRDLPAARARIDAARALAPDEAGVMRIAAALERASGNPRGAIEDYGRVLGKAPQSVPALAGRADALISQDRVAEAEKDLNAAYTVVKNPQVALLTALIQARRGQLREADVMLMKASQVFERVQIGQFLHAIVKLKLGDLETASYMLTRFSTRNPGVQGAPLLLAEVALQQKRPADAIKVLRPLVEANAASFEAVTKLARAYLLAGQADDALRMYQTVVAAPLLAEPMPPLDGTNLIMIYGDAVGTSVEIEKLGMKQRPDTLPVLIDLRRGDLARAAPAIEGLAAGNPADPFVQNLLVSLRLAQKRYPEAAEVLAKLTKAYPEYRPAAFSEVWLLVAQNQPDRARALLGRLAPDAGRE